MRPTPPDRLHHGVAWYPELWPAEQIDRDLAAMRRLGLTVVRIAEFAWSTLEPAEGAIDCAFFRHVMDRAQAAGLRVVLCTPTATPPVWLTHGHPERLHVNADGVVMGHGARQHVCYEEETVRRHCFRIVTAMARELGRHPALEAWQIDNEFKCHVAEDYNPATVARWHAWLEARYGSIERLNAAWGTAIWSQHYQRFDQVPAPGRTPFAHNPSLLTAYRLCNRELIAEFMDAQSALIRAHSAAPITHNFNLGFALNFERMSRDLDFVSWDDYPAAADWHRVILHSDLFRAAKPGRPFWLMETSCAHNGWLGEHAVMHPPGFLRAEAVAAYALGAGAFNYWLWRQQRTGCELPHSGLLQSWGTPGVGHAEVAAVEAARRDLEPLFTTSMPAPAEVALTWSDRGRAMLQTEPLRGGRGRALDYTAIITGWHRRLVELGYHRDLRFEGAALDGLKLLVTPAMPAVDADFLARVQPWIEAGGTWIVAPLTGTRTPEHTAPTDAGLGALDALAGVESVFGFPFTDTGILGSAFGLTTALTGWGLALRPAAGTRSLGTIHGGAADGLAFLTERPLGRGHIVLLAVQPEGEAASSLLDRLIRHCADRAGVSPVLAARPGTLVAPRRTREGEPLLVALDFTGRGGGVTLPAGLTDALTAQPLPAGELTLAPYAHRVFRGRAGQS